jgi:hypothetical protein
MGHTWRPRSKYKRLSEREKRRAFQRQGRVQTYTQGNHELAETLMGESGKQGTLAIGGRPRDTRSKRNDCKSPEEK